MLFHLFLCVAKSDIIQTKHLLTLNNLLKVKVKVKDVRKWLKSVFSYQHFDIFPRFWCETVLMFVILKLEM